MITSKIDNQKKPFAELFQQRANARGTTFVFQTYGTSDILLPAQSCVLLIFRYFLFIQKLNLLTEVTRKYLLEKPTHKRLIYPVHYFSSKATFCILSP